MKSRHIPTLIVTFFLLVAGSAQADDDQPDGTAPKPAASKAAQPAATPEQIDAWISQLDSPRYIERELATRKLSEIGATALGQLTRAAVDRRAEVAARAIQVLWKISGHDKVEIQLAALESLAALPRRGVRRRAENQLIEIRERIALPKVLAWGARFDREYGTPIVDPRTGEVRFEKLILGPDWQGGMDGLDLVADLGFVSNLSVRSLPVDVQDAKRFASMPSLRTLELYGTKVDLEQSPQLQVELPHIQLDIRKGAMLGIRGSTASARAQVIRIEPDSAAERAGLRADDIVVGVDDIKVESFADLTAEIAKFDPGESARLTILRDSESIQRTVTFGQWK